MRSQRTQNLLEYLLTMPVPPRRKAALDARSLMRAAVAAGPVSLGAPQHHPQRQTPPNVGSRH